MLFLNCATLKVKNLDLIFQQLLSFHKVYVSIEINTYIPLGFGSFQHKNPSTESVKNCDLDKIVGLDKLILKLFRNAQGLK